MKVKELIEVLKGLDQEKEVLLLLQGDNPLNDGASVENAFELKGTVNNDYVYIMEG